MTRAARHAQRAGAAALSFDYARSQRHLVEPLEYLRLSFFAAPAPARWHQGILWAGRRGATRAGSPVLHGPGGRTAKALISLGSVVPFCAASRDARAGMAARVCVRMGQNHRTTEPQNGNGRNQPFLEARPVLSRFCGSVPNIIIGRYSAAPSLIAGMPDLGPIGGGARRNFRAPARAAELVDQARGAVAGNGGKPPFFGGPLRRVGMAVSERAAKSVACQVLGQGGRKPAGLAGGRLGGGLVAAIGAGTPTPPSQALSLPLMLPLTFFRVSIDLLIRGSMVQRQDRNGRLAASTGMGSGEREFPLSDAASAGDADQVNAQARVGDGGVPSAAPMRRDPQGLWAGVTHVNG